MGRRFKIAAVVILIGLGVMAIWRQSRYKNISRLPNGEELVLLDVTHGPTNVCFPGGFKDKLIHFLAPKNGIKTGWMQFGPVTPLRFDPSYAVGDRPFTNNIVVWVGGKGPFMTVDGPIPGTDYRISDVRATIADESGEEWDTDPRPFSQPTGDKEIPVVTPWNFPSFPRRGKTLRFRIYAAQKSNSNAWEMLTDFTFANPLRRSYAVWEAPSLPDVQRQGDLEISLVKLVTGMEKVPYYQGIREFSRVTFEVRENGQASTNWLPNRVTATDATGNDPHYFEVNYHVTDGTVYFESEGIGFSPSEVWHMSTRFFGPEKPFWESPEFPVRGGVLLPMNFGTNVQSYLINIRYKQMPIRNAVCLDVGNLQGAYKVGFKVLDDQGRAGKSESGWVGDSGFELQWRFADDAKWAKIVVGLSPLRTFEFLARPTAVTNGVAGK